MTEFTQIAVWQPLLVSARAIVRYMQSGGQVLRCPICSVSNLISSHGIEQVDFLKIDVERGELDVLRGIDIEDWPKIKNVVLELHDIDDRLHKVVGMLKNFEFSSVVAKESVLLQNSGLWNVYAHR